MVPGARHFPSEARGNICSHMSWTEHDFMVVKHLAALGLSDYEVAARTGVPRATVVRWRRRDRPPHPGRAHLSGSDWRVLDPAAYCYLLGAYLGDGHVTHRPPAKWVLRVACDRQYVGIVDEVRRAMEKTFPERSSTRIPSSSGASDVISICHPAIGRAFPQHGPGRKHLRPIILASWQLTLTHAHPEALIRGLIHSDGCRVINRLRTKLPSGRV